MIRHKFNHLKYTETLSKHLHLQKNPWVFLVPTTSHCWLPIQPSPVFFSKLPTSKTSSAAMPLTSKEGIASKGGAATGITGIILKARKSCKISTCFFPPQIPWSSDRRTREWSCHGSWAQMKRLTAVHCEKCKKTNGTKNTQFYASFWGLEKPTHIFGCCSRWRETFIFNILIIKNWWSFGKVEETVLCISFNGTPFNSIHPDCLQKKDCTSTSPRLYRSLLALIPKALGWIL